MLSTIRRLILAGCTATLLVVSPPSVEANDHWDNHGSYWTNYWRNYSRHQRRYDGDRYDYNRRHYYRSPYYGRSYDYGRSRNYGRRYGNRRYRSPGFYYGGNDGYFYYSPRRGFGFGWR